MEFHVITPRGAELIMRVVGDRPEIVPPPLPAPAPAAAPAAAAPAT